MFMRDWKERLDVILKLNERNVLEGPGKISHELAKQKAETEYSKYKEIEKCLFLILVDSFPKIVDFAKFSRKE